MHNYTVAALNKDNPTFSKGAGAFSKLNHAVENIQKPAHKTRRCACGSVHDPASFSQCVCLFVLVTWRELVGRP